jgi:hypothetical protein
VQQNNHDSFAPFASHMPEEALRAPLSEIIRLLDKRYGGKLYAAFDPTVSIPSPTASLADAQWLKTANTVGINVRTIRNFWNVVPYAMTLSSAFNAVHLLPIWEPGVVASLYGPCSWNINPEFFSRELYAAFLHLDTVEKQLKVVMNLLHLMGKAVGMDVVPHTDRFSEMALANPAFFEWLQRRDLHILRHDANLHQDVEAAIFAWLLAQGPATQGMGLPDQPEHFREMPERERLLMLFGSKYDYEGRLKRRKMLISALYDEGFETVPATMGPPYRGIEVNPAPEALVVDAEGRSWRDYRITRPQPFSRVFGPLARYRLYGAKDNNRDWALDFERPNAAAWDYVCAHYGAIQAEFGFDFMRGDMSHVQMRPEGVPDPVPPYYDLLRAVKESIGAKLPAFGYFAESFLAPPGEMAYGDECDHLEASLADSTLGDLQSEPINTPRFKASFAQYRHILETRAFAPNFTLMTADKDDPRFDAFYLNGNELRHFLALFLTDMPTYMALGFECRDPHPQPAPNEHYTKLYVFQEQEGPKATHGPYVWGKNKALHERLVRQKTLAETLLPGLQGAAVEWLVGPDAPGSLLAWTQRGLATHLFLANLDTDKAVPVPSSAMPPGHWRLLFSTHQAQIPPLAFDASAGFSAQIEAGEGWVLERLSTGIPL